MWTCIGFITILSTLNLPAVKVIELGSYPEESHCMNQGTQWETKKKSAGMDVDFSCERMTEQEHSHEL